MAKKRARHDDKRTVFGGARMGYSRTVRAGDFIFLSGHTAVDEQGNVGIGDVRAQARLTFARIKKTLAGVDCTLDDIVKTTVYLADARDFWIMNDVFNEVFPDKAPTRTTITAQPVLDTKIEIDAVVYKPE